MKKPNYRMLQEKFPHLVPVMEATPEADLTVETARDGSLTAQYRGHFLHSRIAPLQEAQRLADYVSRDSAAKGCDALVFLGWGLGYHIEACMEKNNPGTIYVVEPDCVLFRGLLTVRDISHILRFEQMHLCIATSAQDVIGDLQKRGIQNPYVVQSSLLTRNKTDYFRQLNTAIDRHRQQTKINANTLRRFGKLWVKNLLRNLPVAQYAHGIEITETLFSEFPAVLCAAGPTLDDILPFLPQLHESMVIIAVDTALDAVLSCNIEPDFLIVIDPQYWNSRHIDRKTLRRTVVVSDLSTHPRSFRLLPRSLLLSASIFPLGKRFDPPQRASLGAGGSVTTAAWDFARHLGISRLYYAGMDMGFPGKKSHARRTFYERYWSLREERTCPVEGQLGAQIFSGNPFPAHAYDNSVLQSDQRMELYHWWLCARIQESSMSTFSLSPRSRRIEGVTVCRPEEIDAQPCREIIHQRMGTLFRKLQKTPNTQAIIDRSVTGLHKECEAIQNTAREGLRLCKEFLKTGNHQNRQELLKKLDTLDRKFLTHVSKDLFGFLVQDTSEQIFRRTELQAAIDNSILMYQSLYRSAQFHKDNLEKLHHKKT